MHTDRIVRIVLCFHCMDKCKYGQLYPFASAYLIPLMLALYTIQHRRLPQFTVSLYIWHDVEFEKKQSNMLYRNRNLLFFFFFLLSFLHSPRRVERNTCTQPDLQVAQFKIMSCYFFIKMKMFYLWSSRHIIVLILRHASCFLQFSPKLKCSCSPYAFSMYKILLPSRCCHMYRLFYFAPFNIYMFFKNASPI